MSRLIVELSLKLRYIVLILATLTILFGIIQLGDMPVDIYPEFNPPLVEIQTEALGLSAIEMEALITVPLEADLLNGVAWLDQIQSKTVAGLSSVLLVFQPGTDPIQARQMVQERLTQTFALPNVSKPPTMLQPLSTTSRVMMIGLSSDEMSLIDMGTLARWIIKPRLMGVPGVANVAVWGQREWQLQVQVDPERLQEAGVTLKQIIATSGEALWVSPLSFLESSTPGTAGWIDTPNQRLSIRHELPISSAEDMGRIPIEGTAYKLGDVVDIVEDHQPLIGDAILEDGPGLLLVIEKFPYANIIEVSRGIEEALELLSPGLGDIDVDTTVFRSANYIERAADNITISLIISMVLIIFVIGVFLFEWRTALIGFLVILTSIISAALVLYLRGETLNIMVLAGLAAAVGIVVDDALTNTENIQKRLNQHREQNNSKSAFYIIIEASTEFRSSIGFATLVIILIILPIFFLEGLTSSFLQPLAVSYALGVIAAQVVALIITPGLGLIFLSNSREKPRVFSLFNKFQNKYKDILNRSLQSPSKTVIIAVLLAVVCIAALPFIRLSPLPEIQQTNIRIQWEGPPGTSRTEMNRIMSLASAELRDIPGIENVGSHVGRAITGDAIVSINSGELWLNINPDADYTNTVSAVRNVIDGYPGLFHEAQSYQPERIGQALTLGDQDLVIRIYGNEFDVLNGMAQDVKQRIEGINNIVDVQIETLEEEAQVEIKVNLAAAERFQIKPGDVRRAATTLLSGLQVGNLYEEQKVFDVVVWGIPEIRNNINDIGQLLIDTPGGGHVLLSEVAEIRITSTPIIINRDAVSRYIDVRVDVGGSAIDSVTDDIEDALNGVVFPPEYHSEVLSDFAIRTQSQQRILIVVLIIVVGSFLLMQAALHSWPLAFFILLTWPLALAGGVLAVLITGGVFSIGSLVGFLTVLGIAIRNSVILIGHYQRLEDDEGIAFGADLVLRGSQDRARSILITAVAVGVTFLPMLIAGDIPGLEVLHPMAAVVLGGLITATLINLFLLPVLYMRFGEIRESDLGLSPAKVAGD